MMLTVRLRAEQTTVGSLLWCVATHRHGAIRAAAVRQDNGVAIHI